MVFDVKERGLSKAFGFDYLLFSSAIDDVVFGDGTFLSEVLCAFSFQPLMPVEVSLPMKG